MSILKHARAFSAHALQRQEEGIWHDGGFAGLDICHRSSELSFLNFSLDHLHICGMQLLQHCLDPTPHPPSTQYSIKPITTHTRQLALNTPTNLPEHVVSTLCSNLQVLFELLQNVVVGTEGQRAVDHILFGTSDMCHAVASRVSNPNKQTNKKASH